MNKKLLILLLYSALIQAQINGGSSKPLRNTPVNDSFKIEKKSNVHEKTNTKKNTFYNDNVLFGSLCDTVSLYKKKKKSIPKENKAIININGSYITAQEITVQMTADFTSAATTGFTVPIGNLNKKIIDNESSYTGTATANSFRVLEDGIYMINMKVQMSTTYGATPTIGIWDNNAMQWVASVKEQCTTPKNKLQTYILATAKPMVAGHTYSFRASNKFDFTVKYVKIDDFNSAPITQVSLKRVQ